MSTVALLVLAGCAGGIRPVDIESGDMCSFCRMAISQKQYVAEMIDSEGNVLKFDDIGCMLRYRKANPNKSQPAAVFVADSETRSWLNADTASFVRSGEKTPMGSGIIAFRAESDGARGGVKYADLLEQ